MSKALWNRISPPFMLLWSLGTMGCLEPTQVKVEIWTDVPCSEINSVAVFTGVPGEFESKAASSTGLPQACSASSDPNAPAPNRVGSVVIVPSAGKGDALGIKVAIGVGRNAEDCILPEGADPMDPEARVIAFDKCVVARRALNFQENFTLNVPIVLRSSCKNIGCSADTTCVLGECRSIFVDSESCKKPEGCTENDVPLAQQEAKGCGGPSVLSDRFGAELKAGEYQPKIWTFEGQAATIGGGDLGKLRFSAPTMGEAFYTTRYAVHLKDDVFRVQVPATFKITSDTAVVFKVHTGDGLNSFQITNKLNEMIYSSYVNGVLQPGEIKEPYDPVRHLWWGIREYLDPSQNKNVIELQTSADGLAWFKKASFDTPDFAKAVHASLGAVAGMNNTGAGTAEFAYFNTESKSGGWCPAADFSDEFTGTSMLPLWSKLENPEGAFISTLMGGAITLDLTAAVGNSMLTYVSEQAFSLKESSVSMRLANMSVVPPNTEVFIGLNTPGTAALRWGLYTAGGAMDPSFCQLKKFESASSIPYCTPLEKWVPASNEYMFRIQHKDDTLFWQVSSDGGMSYRTVASELHLAENPELNLTEVQLIFGVQTVKQLQAGDAKPVISIEGINPKM